MGRSRSNRLRKSRISSAPPSSAPAHAFRCRCWPQRLFSKLSERAAQGRPLRIGIIGVGKFGSMYLAQLPRTPGVHLRGHRRPRSGQRACQRGTRRLVGRPAGSVLDRRGNPARVDARRRRLACVDGAPRNRDRHRMHRQPDCGCRSLPRRLRRLRRLRRRQARDQRDRRGRRLLRPDPRAEGARGGRDLLDGLWRPTRADLRSGRPGPDLRFSGGRGRTRAQVAAEVPRIDAGDRLGPLGCHRRAGEARRHEPEDVQRLSRRHEARHRKRHHRQRDRTGGARGRPELPAGFGRRHPFADAPEERRRVPRTKGHGRGGLLAAPGRHAGRLRHPQGRMGLHRGGQRLHPALLQGIPGRDRPRRPQHGAVQEMAPDRARARRFRGGRRPAR